MGTPERSRGTRLTPALAVVLALALVAFTPLLLQVRGGGLRGGGAGIGSVRGAVNTGVRGVSGRDTQVRGISERGRSDRASGGRYGNIRDRRHRPLIWIDDDDDDAQAMAQSQLDAARAAAEAEPPPPVYAGSVQPGHVESQLADAEKVIYDRQSYYVAGGLWYSAALQKGKKVYTVVVPPVGATVRSLPDTSDTTTADDTTYVRYKGVVYEQVDRLGKKAYQVSDRY